MGLFNTSQVAMFDERIDTGNGCRQRKKEKLMEIDTIQNTMIVLKQNQPRSACKAKKLLTF